MNLNLRTDSDVSDRRSITEPVTPNGDKQQHYGRGRQPLGLSTAHNVPRRPERKRMVVEADRGGMEIAGAQNGNLVKLVAEKREHRTQKDSEEAPVRCGRSEHRDRRTSGGQRGVVSRFSNASRLRLMRLLNSFDRQQYRPGHDVVFVTLTYPGLWDENPSVWKRHLKAYLQRLERAVGRFPIIWKLEFQKRGAPHFHLIMLVPKIADQRMNERGLTWAAWTAAAWYEVVKSGDTKHLSAGVSLDRARSWNGINAYLSKYMSKSEYYADGDSLGRFWGVWNRDLIPIFFHRYTLNSQQSRQARRILRRHSRQTFLTDRWINQTVFMDYETFLCLLQHLGVVSLPRGRPEILSTHR